jgi:hypothetical protein
MDAKKFKAEHPELFQAIQDEAREEGVKAERKRVNAHLKLGKAYGAMDIALAAIASGVSSSDEEVQADYLSARANAGDQAARQQEAAKVEKVVAGGSPDTSNGGGPDRGDAVMALIDGNKPKKS